MIIDSKKVLERIYNGKANVTVNMKVYRPTLHEGESIYDDVLVYDLYDYYQEEDTEYGLPFHDADIRSFRKESSIDFDKTMVGNFVGSICYLDIYNPPKENITTDLVRNYNFDIYDIDSVTNLKCDISLNVYDMDLKFTDSDVVEGVDPEGTSDTNGYYINLGTYVVADFQTDIDSDISRLTLRDYSVMLDSRYYGIDYPTIDIGGGILYPNTTNDDYMLYKFYRQILENTNAPIGNYQGDSEHATDDDYYKQFVNHDLEVYSEIPTPGWTDSLDIQYQTMKVPPLLSDREYKSNVTLRTALSYYAELMMCNLMIISGNQLKLIPLGEFVDNYVEVEEYTPPSLIDYVSCKISHISKPIGDVVLKTSYARGLDANSTGDTSDVINPINIVDNPLIDGSNGNHFLQDDSTIASAMKQSLVDLNYTGEHQTFELESMLMPQIEVLDKIKFIYYSPYDTAETPQGKEYETIVTKHILEIGENVRSILACELPNNIEKQTSYVSKLGEKITKAQISVDRVNGKITNEIEVVQDNITKQATEILDINSKLTQFSEKSGSNLAYNSVGLIPLVYNPDNKWVQSSTGVGKIYGTQGGAIFPTSISKSQWVITAGNMTQTIKVPANSVVSVSMLLKVENGADGILILKTSDIDLPFEANTSGSVTEIKQENLLLADGTLEVYLSNATGVGQFYISDLMVVLGSTVQAWSQNPSETVEYNLIFDKQGLTLYNEVETSTSNSIFEQLSLTATSLIQKTGDTVNLEIQKNTIRNTNIVARAIYLENYVIRASYGNLEVYYNGS